MRLNLRQLLATIRTMKNIQRRITALASVLSLAAVPNPASAFEAIDSVPWPSRGFFPAYPAIAKQAHASGTVVVQVTIDENGSVISAHAVSGHPLLQAVCVGAARQARFSPTKL